MKCKYKTLKETILKKNFHFSALLLFLILKKVDFNLKHAVGIIAIVYINLSFYKLQ